MMRKIDPFGNPAGFTLLEIVITIILSAILGSILFQFMGSSLTRSSESVNMVQYGFETLSIMERITADYQALMTTDADPLGTLKTRVESGIYGTYASSTEFVSFSGTNEITDNTGDNQMLKVTVTVNDQSVTALFTDTPS